MERERLTWRTSSFSGGNADCVEVAPLPGGGAAVRDSKAPGRGRLDLTSPSFDALLAAVR